MISLKNNRLFFIYTCNVLLKFGLDIHRQTEVRVWKLKNQIWLSGSHFESDIAENQQTSCHAHKKICYWILDLISKAKLKLVSWNQKVQYGHQAAILNVISLKINRLWPMATNNTHMKFGIEVPKQTGVTLEKPCHRQSLDTEKSNKAARRPSLK